MPGFIVEGDAFLPTDYNTGLCACGDHCASCMDVLFCAYCQVSAQYNMLEHGKPGVNGLVCCGLVCVECFLGGCGLVIMSMITRSKANNTFALSAEGGLGTCAKGCCCPACSMCQVHRELSLRGRFPGGICVNAPYVKPGLAVPPPQPLLMGFEGGVFTQPVAPVPLLYYAPQGHQPPPLAMGYYPPPPPGYYPPPQLPPPHVYASQQQPMAQPSIYAPAPPLGAGPYGQATYAPPAAVEGHHVKSPA